MSSFINPYQNPIEIGKRYQKIMDAAKENPDKSVGYAYVYRRPDGFYTPDDKFFLLLDPKNLADFIMTYEGECFQIVITDMGDNFLASTICPGGFLDQVKDMFIRGDLLEHLEPLQMGRRPETPIAVSMTEVMEIERESENLEKC